jgi:hypothetical protein
MPSLPRSRILPALTLAALLPAAATAQDPPDPHCVLTIPETVELGDTWTTCVQAPAGWLAFVLIGGSAGPMESQYGTLSLGAPILDTWPLLIGPTGEECVDHLAHCETWLVGMTGWFQFVAIDPQIQQPSVGDYCLSNAATLTVIDGDCIEPGDFATFTPGGWGAGCSGNNPGCLRDEWFDEVFPLGLVIGDQDGVDGDADCALLLTSSAAVEAFLPSGGTAGKLKKDLIDPVKKTSAGVLAGQLVAATLNVEFDAYGALDALKGKDGVKLADLVYAGGVDDALLGKTVAEVLELANGVISKELAVPVDVDGDGDGDVGYADLAEALTVLNENFDDGLVDNGNLELP